MPGYNHPASCVCGWCYKIGGGSNRGASYVSLPTPAAFSQFTSFTIPNAHCPVCGDLVFFYHSPFGGRVFFDELGPPWPKHPCTDNGRAVRLASSTPRSSSPDKRPWEAAGWMPVIIKNSSMVGSWHLVPMEILEQRLHLVMLSAEPVRVPRQFCASFNGFDRKGYALLSIIDLDAPDSPMLVEVYSIDRFAGTSAFNARKARRGGYAKKDF